MMQACEIYRSTQIGTARPETLIVMLYNGAIKFIRAACDALESHEIQEAGRLLIKAQDIVAELGASLNPEAGEVAANLASLYQYVFAELVAANVKKDIKPAARALQVMEGLSEAWAQALRVGPK